MKSSDFVIKRGALTEYKGNGGEIIIPDGVKSINDFLFEDNYLITKVYIPASMEDIGDMAFACCSAVTNFEVDEGNRFYCSVDGDLYRKYGMELINYAQGKREKHVTILDGVTSIRNVVFKNCTYLESISIPDSVKSIETSAFRGCTNLKSISIPAGVKYLDRWVFLGCSSLSEVILPEGFLYIGESVFGDCTALTDLFIPDSVDTISYCAFDGCNNLRIHASRGSYAEEYAQENNIPFIAI